MKKILFLLSIVSLAAFFAGCSKGDSDPALDTKAPPPTAGAKDEGVTEKPNRPGAAGMAGGGMDNGAQKPEPRNGGNAGGGN